MKKIFVAGHNGMVGGAILRSLQSNEMIKVITRSRAELDLLDGRAVLEFLSKERPSEIYIAAAKVGGIEANNKFRGDFIYENLQIQNNIIGEAFKLGINNILFLGSSCIYPKNSDIPIKENCLLTSSLEQTNEPYAIAKIAGIKLCESLNRQYNTQYISLMPTNLYGPGDNYDLSNSHVVPALVRKFFLARQLFEGNLNIIKNDLNSQGEIEQYNLSSDTEVLEFLAHHGITPKQISIWGSGRARREFLWVDDLASACIYCMRDEVKAKILDNAKRTGIHFLNVGYGEDISISELVNIISKLHGYEGNITYDRSKPDGTYQKLLSSDMLKQYGWTPKVSLGEGLKRICGDYQSRWLK